EFHCVELLVNPKDDCRWFGSGHPCGSHRLPPFTVALRRPDLTLYLDVFALAVHTELRSGECACRLGWRGGIPHAATAFREQHVVWSALQQRGAEGRGTLLEQAQRQGFDHWIAACGRDLPRLFHAVLARYQLLRTLNLPVVLDERIPILAGRSWLNGSLLI